MLLSPIDDKLFDIVSDCNAEQPLNAFFPIDVVLSGISTLVINF